MLLENHFNVFEKMDAVNNSVCSTPDMVQGAPKAMSGGDSRLFRGRLPGRSIFAPTADFGLGENWGPESGAT